jgi:GLPGLI family protein
MKKILLPLSSLFVTLFSFAQQKEGKVIYERITKMQIQVNDNDQISQNLPQSRTEKFELLFGNNKALWRMSDEQVPEDDNAGGGVQIRLIGDGVDDMSYYDLDRGTSTEQRNMFEKKFIIGDSISKLNWKMTGETKTILNHTAQCATAQRIGIRMMMNMDNGKMERKEMADTSTVIAWFTTDIPVATGPGEYQGQLPGLILEMNINNGRQIFKAIEFSTKTDIAAIKEPKNGKKLTRDEFRKETQKMMDKMEQNNQGGNRVIRFNN